MSRHRIANRAKATRVRAADRRRRGAPRDSVVTGWLGVGALTLGMGVAVLSGGSGVAYADGSNDAAPSTAASARSAGPVRAGAHENSSGRRSSVGSTRSVAHAAAATGGVTRSAAAVNKSTRVIVTNAVPDTGPAIGPTDAPALAASTVSTGSMPTVRSSLNRRAAVAVIPAAAAKSVAVPKTVTVDSVAAAAPPVRQTPVQAVVGVVVNALVALGGLDPLTPEPAPGNPWQLGLYSVARRLADAVNPGGVPTVATTSVGTPDAETGVVAGRVLFRTAAGDPLTYRVSVDPTEGTATINPDGSYSFVPLQAARLGDGPVTVTMLVTAYHGVQKTSSIVNIPLPKAAFAVPVVIRVGNLPSALALSPDGTRLVVAHLLDGTVSVLDTGTNTQVTPDIAVGNDPAKVTFTADGSVVYVANVGTASSPPSVARVSLLTSAVDTIPISGAGLVALGPANTPAAGRLYLTNSATNAVSIIDTSTNVVLPGAIPVGQTPGDLAVSPDGERVYVANTAGQSLSVISTATNTVTATVPLAAGPGVAGPGGLVVTPNGKIVYVSLINADNTLPSSVWVIDTATNTVKAPPIPVGVSPQMLAVSPDGSVVYVANQLSNTVSAISTATNTVIKTINVGQPVGIAVSSTRLYVANLNTGTVSVITL